MKEEPLMVNFLSRFAIARAVLSLACLVPAPALAASKITFVSGKGTDSGDCASPAAPCRTFQFAVSQTKSFGEVKALDPAGYGRVTITQSVSITGVPGASINAAVSGSDDITINAGPNDVINLSHLNLDGGITTRNGIVFNSGASLTIDHCTLSKFSANGILLQPAAQMTFLIADTIASDNAADGIGILPIGNGSANGTLYHVSMTKNRGSGLDANGGSANVFSVESTANGNSSGFGNPLVLFESISTGNDCGVSGFWASARNNFINGNTHSVTDCAFGFPVDTQ
jgi:hypothetical protein